MQDVRVETPPAVIAAISLGVAPLPFLAVYSVLFIAHGFVYPVQPVDITSTRTGEGIAGIIAALLFLLGAVVVYWFLNGQRRWPFVIGQLATLVTCVDFVVDPTIGARAVSASLALAAAAALVLSALPVSWRYLGFGARQDAAA